MAEKESKGIKKFLEEFKAFAMRGNVLDMAVGVVIGSAFTAIVNSLVNDIISPAIGLFFNADFSNVGIHIGDVTIGVGSFINAIINFLLIAFVLFCIVKAINSFAEASDKMKSGLEIEKKAVAKYRKEGLTREEARKKYAEDIAKAETAKAEEARLAEEKAAAEKAALEAKETANTRLLEEIRDLLKQQKQ